MVIIFMGSDIMRSMKREVGNYGEGIAADYVEKMGYNILKKNFKCSAGEIDIIAFKDKVLCFIEVKSRYSSQYGLPREAITYFKKDRMIKSSNYFIHKHGLYDYYVRFDILEVIFNHNNSDFYIDYIKDAFRLF